MEIEVNDAEKQQALKYKEEGNTYFKKQQFSKALECYQRAIQTNPTEATFYQNRAACYLNLNRYYKCIQDAQEAIKLDPTLFKAHRFLAQSYLYTGKINEAKQSALDAKKIIANDQQVNNIMDNCRAASNALEQLNTFLNTENYTEAATKLEYLVEKCPGSEEIKQQFVEVLIKKGDLKKAKETMNKIQYNDPYYQALLEFYSQNNDKAKKICMQNQTSDQKFVQLIQKIKQSDNLKQKGNDALKAQKWQDAINSYEECLKLDKNNKQFNSIIWSNLGLVYMKQKKNDKALDCMNQSINSNPDYFKAYLRRGEIYMEQEDYDRAIRDYRKVKEIDSTQDTSSFISKAQAKQKKKEKKDYYAILGVTKESSQDEIKRAYKKLALKWHPDRQKQQGADPEKAQKMFKDINEAYSTLSDPKKKQMYDLGGGENMFGGGGMPEGFNPNDIFSQFFSDKSNQDGDFQNMFGGSGNPFSSMFGGNMGGGGRKSQGSGFPGGGMFFQGMPGGNMGGMGGMGGMPGGMGGGMGGGINLADLLGGMGGGMGGFQQQQQGGGRRRKK